MEDLQENKVQSRQEASTVQEQQEQDEGIQDDDDDEDDEKQQQQYKLCKVRSILDLEREVIESLTLTSAGIDDCNNNVPLEPNVNMTTRGFSPSSPTTIRSSSSAPAWDDRTLEHMLRSDSVMMMATTRHSSLVESMNLSGTNTLSSSSSSLQGAKSPRRISSSVELSTLAQLTKSGARQSAPPQGWNLNSNYPRDNKLKAIRPITTNIRQSSPAPGWTTTQSSTDSIFHQQHHYPPAEGKLITFRTGNLDSSQSKHNNFRGVMASFRNFLSSSDNTNTTTTTITPPPPPPPPTRVDVSPYFPHITRRREDDSDCLDSQEDDSKNLTRFRLIKRNLPHFQSINQVSIQQRSKVRLQKSQTAPPGTNPYIQRYVYQFLPSQWLPTHWALLYRDWFHILLRWPTPLSILFWSILWTFFIIVFALIYLAASKSSSNTNVCTLASGFTFDFTAAFSFSLETAMTVGYTLPGGTNSFFEKCPGIQIAIYSQIIFNLILDGLLVTFLYTRISRSELRSTQLLFGNKALLRPIQYENSCGKKITRWTLEVRVFDADAAHPICEAHVRIYASILGQNQHLQVCRLLRPDDSLNGFLFTSVPYSIIHEIDFFSPLAPPSVRKMYKEHGNWLIGWNGLERRESDARNQTSYGWVCPVCATTCGEMGRLISHIKYMKLQDQSTGIPWEDSHQRVPDSMLDFSHVSVMQSIDVDALKNHLQNLEIICVVEGIDPITSGSFQALQSYTIDDLVFGGSFMPCVRLEGGEFVVDLDRFHRIIRPGYLVSNQMKDL